MAIIKCKMCGGALKVEENSTVCECEYCGTKQTVPTLDNEKKLTLFNRASRLLRNCEFDKAYGVFENIVAEFPEEAEAYWGLCLCRYGIEYVNDPVTGKKISTCHRTVLSSIMDDSDFDLACENADGVAKRLYREEAKAIDRIQQEILRIVESEEPYDVFICYKELDDNGARTEDSVLAQEIYDSLTVKGLKVFFSRITLEAKLGEEYEPYIYAALQSAKVMLAVGTSFEHFDAVWVKNEWARFLEMMKTDSGKKLIPCFKGIDAYDMPREFKNFLAQDMGKLGWQQDLIRGVLKICGKDKTKEVIKSNTADSKNTAIKAQTEAMLKRGYMMLEDGEYGKANEFFEKVLNNDAECGQAYWGKALASARVPNAGRYGSVFLFNCFKSKAEQNTIILSMANIADLARKADGSGLLTEFSDQELRELLRDIEYKPIEIHSSQRFYRNQAGRFTEIGALQKLANTRDFDRAVKYADNVVREEEQKALTAFKDSIKNAIREEEEKETEAKQSAESMQECVVEAIKSRIADISQEYEAQRSAMEAEQQIAERQAEENYQAALAKFETEYQTAVNEQNEAYQREVELWEKKKQNYDLNYEKTLAEREVLKEKIEQLKTEKDNLHGLFTGKRRKEIEDNLALLNIELKNKITPENPGIMPEKAPALWKGVPPQREDFKVSQKYTKPVDFKERIKNSLSPAYKAFHDEIEQLKDKIPGDEIQFGNYPGKEEKKEPIEWMVLSKEDNKLFVISKYGVDCQQYHNDYEDVKWETCRLRSWLNGTFLSKAFTDEERAIIPTVSVSAARDRNDYSGPGRPTQDKIFLLSIPEVNQYLYSKPEMNCAPTEYAIKRGCQVASDYCRWWLRSPPIGYGYYYADIVSSGSVIASGSEIIDKGTAVRPVMWIVFQN